jgi:RNA polymerase sigma-70 factor (ECF subfamily)
MSALDIEYHEPYDKARIPPVKSPVLRPWRGHPVTVPEAAPMASLRPTAGGGSERAPVEGTPRVSSAEDAPTPGLPAGWFASTHWSVVLAAAQADDPDTRAALEKLCRAYWKPLFVFARRLGYSQRDAEDLTQGFFEQFLGKGYIRAADPRRGRFRAFLLTSFRHFVGNEWAKNRTAKRGARVTFVSFEELTPGESAQLEQGTDLVPEAAYDRQWALRVYDLALSRLRSEFAEAGKEQQFDLLKPFLSKLGSNADYAPIADRCGRSEGAVAVAVRRLRVRYGELLRAEVANTVASPEDIEDELRVLRTALTT